MTDCRDLEPLLAAYVDGEMAPDERARVTAHLATCPPCRQAVAGERQARDVLHARRHQLAAAAPAQLHRRCAACVCGPAPLSAGARGFPPRTWVPFSFAATILLAVAAVFFMGLNGSVEALATQLALDHVKCFQFSPPHAEVDSAMASETWKASYGWLINVPKSAPVEQLELLDVRRCMSTQGASAHIMYRWRGQPLSVYVLNSVPKSDIRVERLVSRVGQEAIIWSDAGRTYAVVGRGPPNDLQHIARYLRASTR
jgi:anti-sigma factor RsiW